MDTGWFAVSERVAFQFFLEQLKDVVDREDPPADQLLYNASLLAHFATTSTASIDTFPPAPASLSTVFDLYVLDHSGHDAPDILEAAAAQCLVLTGFFHAQQRRRHQVAWYARLGAAFFAQASERQHDQARARLMASMARRFEFWRHHQHRLAVDLREQALPLVGRQAS